MAQLIVIAVLHSDSDLIKIHMVNGKKDILASLRKTLILNIIYII